MVKLLQSCVCLTCGIINALNVIFYCFGQCSLKITWSDYILKWTVMKEGR